MYPAIVLFGAGVALVGAYFLGQFPSADLIAGDRARGGSGNPGASNVYRQAGARAGAMVFIADAAKGAVAVVLGLIVGDRRLALACGAAAIAGHCYPALRRFRGGKGVATTFGVLAVLQPIAGLAAAATWAIVIRLSRKASAASLLGIIVATAVVAVVRPAVSELAGMIAIATFIVVRHIGNIRRLVRGEERSLS